MMMLIFSIILVCLYVYFSGLVFWVLRNTHFKEHRSVVAPKYSNTIWKIILKSLNYVQCLNIASMEKAWFCKRLFFEVVIVMLVSERSTIVQIWGQGEF